MSGLKTYRRKQPLYVKARDFEPGEVVYDANGEVIRYDIDRDLLVVLETDKFRFDKELFGQLYEETSQNANGRQLPSERPPEFA